MGVGGLSRTITISLFAGMAFAAFAVTLLMAGNVTAKFKRATGEKIKTTLSTSGATVTTGNLWDYDVEIELKPSGTMEGQTADGYSDSGKWWIKGDAICIQFVEWLDGDTKCLGVEREGDQIRLIEADGSIYDTQTLRLKK